MSESFTTRNQFSDDTINSLRFPDHFLIDLLDALREKLENAARDKKCSLKEITWTLTGETKS